MSQKKSKFQAAIERAEKFFIKENFPLALKELNKIDKKHQSKEIKEKINICLNEIKKTKSKDLIKRARKFVKKRDLKSALKCFEEAYEMTNEDWIKERINELSQDINGVEQKKSAKEFEKKGQFLEAAAIYEEAYENYQNEKFLLNAGRCFVKGKKYEEALQIFEKIETKSYSAIYDKGYAYANTGQYLKCLKEWDKISIKNKELLKQKALIQSFLHAHVLECFNNKGDYEQIFYEASYLMDSMQSEDELKNLKVIIEQSKYHLIEILWKKEDFQLIRDLLIEDTHNTDPLITSILAKTLFKLSQKNDNYLTDLSMFWLTALYNPDIFSSLGDDNEGDKIRDHLLQMVDEVIKSHSDDYSLQHWETEKKLTKLLNGLIKVKNQTGWLYSPRYALKFNKWEDMQQIIRENKDKFDDYFDDAEEYYHTGAYYSPAMKALFELRIGNYEKAMESLPQKMDKTDDEFYNYGKLITTFYYGMYCITREKPLHVKFNEALIDLFKMVPKFKDKFLQEANDAHTLKSLTIFEDLLGDIHKKSDSQSIKELLSLVMTRRGIKLYNQNKLTSKAMDTILKKALKLHPENELAHATHKENLIDLEVIEISKSFDRMKMNRACKIASESEHPKVKEFFFEFIERHLNSIDQKDFEYEERLYILEEMLHWTYQVDKEHPLVYELDKKIYRLKN